MSADDSNIPVADLLHCLQECSEKAAQIARVFRSQNDLFDLLVEEKSEIQKNRKKIQDFKTLADVLVQETIKRDVARKFPVLSSKIQGEEQNSFQNTLGECIKVELTDCREETTNLLCKVLDGKVPVAESLATIVHSEDTLCDRQYVSSEVIPADNLGVWIDPIDGFKVAQSNLSIYLDSTAEYIQGKQNNPDENGIELYGLKCVCVLIGVYDLQTGIPVIGIINQPFYKESSGDTRWASNIYWGISHSSIMEVSPSFKNRSQEKKKIIVTSTFEKKELQTIMRTKYSVVHAAGAGYKCLAVAKSKAELYVLSLQNTHFWDTCGPHSILAAQGGGIVNFNQIVSATETIDQSNVQNYQLKYSDSTNPEFRNVGGLIAYKDVNDLIELLNLLREKAYQAN